jgi:hypothetical protein
MYINEDIIIRAREVQNWLSEKVAGNVGYYTTLPNGIGKYFSCLIRNGQARKQLVNICTVIFGKLEGAV